MVSGPEFKPPGDGWVKGPLFPPDLADGPVETVRHEVASVGHEDRAQVWHRRLPSGGVWAAYYSDWSGIAVFESELEAFRYAAGRDMNVKFWPYGTDAIRELS